jgi:hypothetical protein
MPSDHGTNLSLSRINVVAVVAVFIGILIVT